MVSNVPNRPGNGRTHVHRQIALDDLVMVDGHGHGVVVGKAYRVVHVGELATVDVYVPHVPNRRVAAAFGPATSLERLAAAVNDIGIED